MAFSTFVSQVMAHAHTLKFRRVQVSTRTHTNNWRFCHENQPTIFAWDSRKFVYSICAGPSMTANNSRKSSGQGWELYFMCRLILKLRQTFFFQFSWRIQQLFVFCYGGGGVPTKKKKKKNRPKHSKMFVFVRGVQLFNLIPGSAP